MRRVRVSGWVLAAGFAASGLAGGSAPAATGAGELPQVAEARVEGQVADLTARYIQEDGPASGNVKVVLTPDTRTLSVIEARMAAEQAFLDALNSPASVTT